MRFGTSVPRNRATAVVPGSSLNNFFSSSGLFARGIKLTWRSLALISSYVIIPARCLRHCFINVTVLYNFVDFRSWFAIKTEPYGANPMSLLDDQSQDSNKTNCGL
ncbi:hypothetical protein H9L39_10496 [Fusarium oxysporum f. sp. albedinis]|nr:hypothetical protein H9L39_10496 [Fusarium oxysporum f. sp. albedinis]